LITISGDFDVQGTEIESTSNQILGLKAKGRMELNGFVCEINICGITKGGPGARATVHLDFKIVPPRATVHLDFKIVPLVYDIACGLKVARAFCTWVNNNILA
jgi:hypothetical protein